MSPGAFALGYGGTSGLLSAHWLHPGCILTPEGIVLIARRGVDFKGCVHMIQDSGFQLTPSYTSLWFPPPTCAREQQHHFSASARLQGTIMSGNLDYRLLAAGLQLLAKPCFLFPLLSTGHLEPKVVL